MESSTQLIRKARIFDFYARHVWRVHRVLARKHLAARCRQCVNSSVYSDLDSRGVCEVCRTCSATDAEVDAVRDEVEQSALRDVLEQSAGAGEGAHDALVMVSGGKDSALLLHELRLRFPSLRLLSYTVDNGFMSPVALENANRYTAKLGVDHLVFRPRPDLYVRSFRHAILHAPPGKGSFETVDRIDAQIGFDSGRNLALRHRIPLVLFGFNRVQMRVFWGVDNFEVPEEQACAATTEVVDAPLADVYEPDDLKVFWDPARHPGAILPRMLAPLSVWAYDEQGARDRCLELELITPGNESALVTNHAVVTLMVALDYRRLGYADFEPQFADMVRRGEADARYWRSVFEMLEYSAKTGWMIASELREIAASLDFDLEQLGLTFGRRVA